MIKNIYLIHHSHTDLGYTHPQPMVRFLHARYIDEVLREVERTRDYPSGAQMKWTCETLYPVFDWWKQATDDDRKRFQKYEREGRIEVTGMWNITTQSSPPRAWRWMLDRVTQARDEMGFTIRSAMLSDINGAPWALADLLPEHGIHHFTMAINEHFGKSCLPRLYPFCWAGPNGGTLQVFNGLHYNNNQYFGIPYNLEQAQRGVAELQKICDGWAHFNLDFMMFQVTRPDFNDNGGPDPQLPDFVQTWNQKACQPRMEIVTVTEFFERVQKSAFHQAPTHHGEWTDFWNFGAASTPYETSLTRRAYGVIEEAEMLATQSPDRQRIVPWIDEALEQAVFHDEHTWGADVSVTEPHLDTARSGLHFNNDFAHCAYQGALLARAEGLASMLRRAKGTTLGDGQHLLVVNTLDHPRRAAIELPVAWMRSDVCPTAAHLHRMQNTPINWPPTTVPPSVRPVPESFATADTLRWEVDLPATAHRVISADDLFAAAEPVRIHQETHDHVNVTLANTHFTIRIDERTGGLSSMVWNETGRELLGVGEVPNGVPVYETPVGGHRSDIHPTPDWTRFMGYKGWNTQWQAQRHSAQPAPTCITERSNGRMVWRQTYQHPEARTVHVQLTLDNALPIVAVDVSIDFKWNEQPCAWYWPMQCALNPDSTQFNYDQCGVPVTQGRDQLPGANMDYHTVHRWVRLSDEQHSMLLFPLDTPIVSLGGFLFGRMSDVNTPRQPLVLPMLHSNYWDTNYAASCTGQVHFRFGIAPGEAAATAAEANRLSAEYAHPPLLVPMAGV